MRAWLAIGLGALAASCGGLETDDQMPCTAQSKCGMGVRRVCDDGYCSDVLPNLSDHLQTLTLSLPVQVRLAAPQGLRVAIVYPKTPDGRRVVCPGTATGTDLAIPGMGGLSDDRRFNLTATTSQLPLRSVSDSIITAANINGPGRIVYVELYRTAVSEDDPVSGGAPIAAGCLADAPYDDDPKKAPVNLTVAPTP
ncbi:MAG: hypothetical protein RL199_403 [Pseudomonadota bacterium]|jgi:hypothetical protein